MEKRRISGLAERQSLTNTFLSPPIRNAATRLSSGAKSVSVASCRASGPTTRLSISSPSDETWRKRIEGNSSAPRFGVVHPGSRNMGFEGASRAKCASSLASADIISLAVAAASAGHKKGVKGTKAHRQCKRHHQTVGLTRRIVNAAERQ